MNSIWPAFIVLVVVIALIVGIDVYLTRKYIAIGVKLATDAKAFSREMPGATQRILVIGDSTAVGTGAETPEVSMAGRIGAEFPDAEIVNLGVNGSKTKDLIPRLTELQGERFDIIVLHTGGNDIVRFTPLDELSRDIRTVFDLATNMSDRVVVLHGGNVGTSKLLPFGTRWLFTIRTKQVRAILMEAAGETGVRYVDMMRAKKDDPYAQDPKQYYSPDFFHPSGEGYRDWFDLMRPHLLP